MILGRGEIGSWRNWVQLRLSQLKSTFFEGYQKQPLAYGLGALASVACLLWLAFFSLQMIWLALSSPFDFLADVAGFDISQTLIDYSQSASYGRAFLVGLVNTLMVSGLAIIFATILGFIIGIARLSNNWIVAKIAMAYVEIIRNIPLLLQLFFWYFAVLRSLPHPKQSHAFFDSIYLNKRGLFFPEAIFEPAMIWVWISVFLSIIGGVYLYRKNKDNHKNTGDKLPYFGRWLLVLIFFPFAILVLLGVPLHFEYPVLGRFNLRGGVQILPEFSALFLALSLYTASYIAEIIRSGILAVNKGQNEAAVALGLSQNRVLSLVIIPQAMRIIIPPLTNQYMNTIKNSSLAVAIAYPDLVHVTMGATLSQTGKAVELVMLVMAVYLFLSLMTSFFMGWFDQKMSLVER